jgi:hypothetical protein
VIGDLEDQDMKTGMNTCQPDGSVIALPRARNPMAWKDFALRMIGEYFAHSGPDALCIGSGRNQNLVLFCRLDSSSLLNMAFPLSLFCRETPSPGGSDVGAYGKYRAGLVRKGLISS